MQQSALERRRLRAARLFARGESQAEVARRCGVSRTTAMRWSRAYEAEGVSGLKTKGPRGRPPRLDARELRVVEGLLRRGAEAAGYPTDLWTLPRVREVIRKATGVDYHPGHVWRILHSLGWSSQRPTTRAKERDEQAVARWKRTVWPRVKKGLERERR